jgi:hypothetical protein
MSAIPNITSLLGKNFVKLSGPENYTSWKKDFKPIASLNGVWALYQGTTPVIDKPTLQAVPAAAGKARPNTRSQNTPPPTGPAADDDAAPTNYAYHIAIYNVQLSEWRENEKTVRFALALLQYAVEPWVWPTDAEDPAAVWETVKANNEADAETRLDRALTQLDKIKLDNFATTRDYLVHFDSVHQDIKEAGGSYAYSQLTNNVIRGLPGRYTPFITYWQLTPATGTAEAKYAKFRTSLLQFSDNNKERWDEQDKNRKDKDKAKPTNSNNTGNTGGDNHNGNSKEGKKPRLTCTWCGYRGHSEDICRNKAAGKPRADPSANTNVTINVKQGDRKPDDKKGKGPAVGALATEDDSGIRKIAAAAFPLDFDLDLFNSTLKFQNEPYCTLPPPSSTPTSDKLPEAQKGDAIELRGAGMEQAPRGHYMHGLHVEDHDNTLLLPKLKFSRKGRLAMMGSKTTLAKDTWLCDSGASVHITNDRSLFVSFRECSSKIGTCSDGSNLLVEGIGTIEIKIQSRFRPPIILTLGEVAYAPNSRCNLLSIPTLIRRANMAVFMDMAGMVLYDADRKDIAFAPLDNGLFLMAVTSTAPDSARSVAAAAVDFNDPVWHEHRRLGHLSIQNMRHLAKISTGMNLTDKQIQSKLGDVCPICWTTRNLNSIPRDPARRRYENAGDLVILDTWGPYPIYGLKGERWALFLTDDATRYTWAVFLTTKDLLAQAVIDLIQLLETSLNIKIRRARLDNEFLQKAVQEVTRNKGISIETSVPYAHHHAGTAERGNRAIRERASALIHDQYPPSPITRAITGRTEEFLQNASLPEGLWVYAVMEALWKKNRSPTRAHNNKKTPFEALTGLKPDLSNEHIWGARVYVTYAPELRGTKLHGPRGWIGYYLCAESETICKVWDPEKKHVKRVATLRVDDTTGMDDPQPGRHINERVPRQQVDNAPEQWPEESDDSDSDQDDEENDDNGALQPPVRSHHFGGMATITDNNSNCGSDLDNNNKLDPPDDPDSGTLSGDSVNRDFEPLSTNPAAVATNHTQPCGTCYRRQRHECRKTPTELDGKCDNCRKYRYRCLPLTQHDIDQRAKSNAKQKKKYHHQKNAPKTSAFFASATQTPSHQSTALNDDVLVPASDNEHELASDTHSETHVSESEHDTLICSSCVKNKSVCQPGTGAKCGRCEKTRARCVPATTEQILRANNACNNCRSGITNALTCNGQIPCNHCTEDGKDLQCKKRQFRPTGIKLPLEGRCGTCQVSGEGGKGKPNSVSCDGQFPCNVCTQNKRQCVRKENKHKDKCIFCRASQMSCNKEDFCSACIKSQQSHCSYFAEDSAAIVRHYQTPEDVPAKYQSYSCPPCSAAGRTCSDGAPCTQCLEGLTYTHRAYETCTKRNSPTTIVQYEIAAYTYERNEHNYIDSDSVTRKPEYKGTLKGRTATKGSFLDKEVPEDDSEAVAFAAIPPSWDDDLTFATEDDRLDGDILDQMSDNEDDIYDDDLLIFAMTAPAAILDIRTPRSYKEAMSLPEAKDWDAATWKEIKALIAKGVFTVVLLPPGKKALSTKLVFKLKLTPSADISSFKARIVARGFMQKHGIDFDESWSPTVRSESVRILLAICALLGWVRTQIDIPTAYLHAALHEEVYARPPPPVELPLGHVWKLNKALYGLVQSARAWFHHLKDDVVRLGFRASSYDPCVYIHTTRPLILSVHVDDIGIYAQDNATADWFKEEMFRLFNISMDKQEPTYLGMHIVKDAHSIAVHQSGYVRQILHRYKLDTQPHAPTPCDHRVKLELCDTESSSGYKIGYLQKFGSANYLPTLTRPDVAYAVSLCGRFNANPGQHHMDALHRIYAYIANTPSLGITYENGDPELKGYVDADWAGDSQKRKSTTGWVFTLAGGPVSWSSRRQSVVALSTCEAEYMAASEAAKEACWIKRFINDLGTAINFKTIPLHVDNASAIKLTNNPEFHQRSKHIDIRHHFIRECIDNGDIIVKWIPGPENPADMFTKALTPPLFEKCRDRLHMTNIKGHSNPR